MSHPPRCAPAPAPLVRTPASSRAGSSTDAGALAFPALPRPADRPPRAPPRGPPTSLAPRSPPAAQVRRPEAHPARRRSLRPPACVGQSSCPCAGQPRPTGVGRPGSWVWLGVCAPARAAACPIRLHRRRPLACTSRHSSLASGCGWLDGVAMGPPLCVAIQLYTARYTALYAIYTAIQRLRGCGALYSITLSTTCTTPPSDAGAARRARAKTGWV